MRNFKEKEIISIKQLVILKTLLFNKFSKIAIFIVFIQIIFGSILIFDNRIRIKTKFPTIKYYLEQTLDTWNIKDYLGYSKDIFKSFLTPNRLNRLDLNLSYKNALGLDNSRDIILEDKSKLKYFKGNLLYKNQKIPIKLKAKGSRKMHVQNFKNMSFKVDIRGDKRLEGMEEFSLQIPPIRNYTSEYFAAKLMNHYSILSPRHQYVRLYINGENVGIRHIEEGFTRELIESYGKRYGPIYYTDNNFNYKVYGNSYWSKNNSELLQKGFYILDSINEKNKEVINKNFDIEKWAQYFAISDALNLFHGTLQRSVRFYLNPTSGLFEPVFYNGHYGTGKYENWEENKFNFSDLINLDKNNCGWICNEAKGPLYKKFFEMLIGTKNNANVNFYIEYKKMLDLITSDEEYKNTLYPIWNSLSSQRGEIYRGFWRINKWDGMGIAPHVAPLTKIRRRITLIKNRIKISEGFDPIFELNKEEKTILAENRLSEFPIVLRYKCRNLETKPKLLLVGKPIKFNYSDINNCRFEEIYYSLNNDDFRPLDQGNIKSNNTKSTLKFDINKNDFKTSIKDKYKLPKNISSKIINNKNIIIDEGEIFCLKKETTLHIKDSVLIINGSFNNPVKFESCSDEGGGGLIIENSEVKISNLIIKDQNAPKKDLRILYGGLNFINSKVNIDSLLLKNSKAEDAVNFIDSKVQANSISVKNANSDAIDSDNSIIKINSLNCLKIGNDCLDLSFSFGEVNYMEANEIGDKGVSLGEKSELNLNNLNIKNSEIGVVSKDSSTLKLNNMTHSNVKLTFSAYIKKDEFGSPSIIINNLIPKGNTNYLIGKDTDAFIFGSKITSNLSSKQVEGLLYGNNYGVKTIRR